MPRKDKGAHGFSPRIHTVSIVALALSTILSIIAIVCIVTIFSESSKTSSVREQYEECSEAAKVFLSASDSLTSEARLFVFTGDSHTLQRTCSRR